MLTELGKQEWQPIETVPENKDVLIVTESDNILIGFYDGTGFYDSQKFKIAEPAFWMPLPKPPQQSNSSETPNGSTEQSRNP